MSEDILYPVIGFRSAHIERAQNRGVLAVDAFLDHFDAIFTLNQDTYLELSTPE